MPDKAFEDYWNSKSDDYPDYGPENHKNIARAAWQAALESGEQEPCAFIRPGYRLEWNPKVSTPRGNHSLFLHPSPAEAQLRAELAVSKSDTNRWRVRATTSEAELADAKAEIAALRGKLAEAKDQFLLVRLENKNLHNELIAAHQALEKAK